MNKKALFYAVLIVLLFMIFSHVIFALIFRLVPIILFLGLGYLAYQVIKDKV
jgi:hypothetical protein